jgi:ABC-2 type transport system permease protein
VTGLVLGQALVGLVKSADSINAVGRVLVLGLVLLSSLGQSGTLGSAWESISRWSPVGVVMNLFAAVLDLSTWDAHDSLTLLASGGYIVVFAAVGIRWFQWDAR